MFEFEIRNIDISGRFLHVILTQTTASGKKVKPLPPPVSVGVPCFSQNGGVGIVEDTSSGGWVTVSKFCKQRCFLFSFLFIVGDFEWDMWSHVIPIVGCNMIYSEQIDRLCLFGLQETTHSKSARIRRTVRENFSWMPSAVGIHIDKPNHTQFWIYERVYFWNHDDEYHNPEPQCFVFSSFSTVSFSGLFCVMCTRVQILSDMCFSSSLQFVSPQTLHQLIQSQNCVCSTGMKPWPSKCQ